MWIGKEINWVGHRSVVEMPLFFGLPSTNITVIHIFQMKWVKHFFRFDILQILEQFFWRNIEKYPIRFFPNHISCLKLHVNNCINVKICYFTVSLKIVLPRHGFVIKLTVGYLYVTLLIFKFHICSKVNKIMLFLLNYWFTWM